MAIARIQDPRARPQDKQRSFCFFSLVKASSLHATSAHPSSSASCPYCWTSAVQSLAPLDPVLLTKYNLNRSSPFNLTDSHSTSGFLVRTTPSALDKRSPFQGCLRLLRPIHRSSARVRGRAATLHLLVVVVAPVRSSYTHAGAPQSTK
ncbi:hypothetical protein LIA77_00733 [Sarocladium implicatum]|nr:hypothetical protein LIA77_00733 [Sarocladium implicatum]